MRALLNACIILLVMNIASLFVLYGAGATGASRDTAQSLGKLISAYSEPNSNPQFLVSAENQCRFWGAEYCSRAIAKRKSMIRAYAAQALVPEEVQSTQTYATYLSTRRALTQETSEFIAFLNTSPSNEEYVGTAKEFEEQAGVLVGQLISYLYEMQQRAITKQTTAAEQIMMAQYLALVAVLFLICILRFRRGGRGYGNG